MTYSDYLTNPVHSKFSFSPVSEKETLNIINNLKNKKCYGIDGISNVLLKSIANEILKPLILIINQSLATGIFPDAFKTSKVTPLYKKGDKTDLNNYIPISILPTISKVFIYNCMTMSLKTIYYASNNTVSGPNILRNSPLLNWWIS